MKISCLLLVLASASFQYVKAASTTIRGAYTVCQEQEEWYTIDGSYTTGQEWWVEGGEIIDYSYFGDAFKDERSTHYWNFWATNSNVFCFPFVVCQDYVNEANSGGLRPSSIKVRWTGQGQGFIKCRARDFGLQSTQHAYDEKVITIYGKPTTQQINSVYLSGNASPICDQYTSIRPMNLPEYYGASYNWSVPSEAVEESKNKYNLNIKGYNILTGFRSVSYTITPANGCGSTITRTFGLSIQAKKAGPLLDNTKSEIITDANGIVQSNLIPNTSSQIDLRLQNTMNGVSYTWTVPNAFHSNGSYTSSTIQTATGQYNGNMPSNALIDYNGQVTVNGFCGTQTYPFIIKSRQAVTLPENIESCACNVEININNPNNDNIYSVWEQTGKGGSIAILNNSRVRFTAPSDGNGGCIAGTYTIGMSIAGVNGNKTTNITIGGNTDKWLSGTLSDVRKNVASNLVYTTNQRLFFSARDGKLYYYEFDRNNQKWAPIQYAPSVTSVKNVAGNFQNIAARSTNVLTEVFYNDISGSIYKSVNGGVSQKINGSEGSTGIMHLDVLSAAPNRNNVIFRSSDGITSSIKYISSGTTNASNTGITNVDNSALLGHGGNIYFLRNQELYRAPYTNGASQSKISGTFKIHPKTSYGFDNDDKLYVCEASGKIIRIHLSTLAIETVVNIAGYCEGEFAINPTYNNAVAVPVIYAKHKVAGQPYFTMKKAFPTILNYGAEPATSSTYDYVAHSPIYVYPHVYYVAETAPEGVNSVWNLYFKENCTPNIFRKGDLETETSSTANNVSLKIYPNPMGNILQVEAMGAERAELLNTLGSKVASFDLKNGQASINTEQLSAGVYILNLFAGTDIVATQKLVK